MKSFVPIAFIAVGLTSTFSTLKLEGFIDWSWWWVLSPLWISVIGVMLFFAALFGFLAKWGP